MRQPDFSETSYGYALTKETTHALGSNLIAAPHFPTLRKEGGAGGGYDVKLDRPGVPLLIQFKRPDVMVSRAAKEFRVNGLPLTLPFYRMPLRTSEGSRQHEMLLQHCANGSEVYYASPIFHSEASFTAFYMAGSVSDNSIFVDPADVGPLDQKPHHLSYSTKNNAWRYSDVAVHLEGDFSKEAMARSLSEALVREGKKAASETLKTFLSTTISVIKQGLGLDIAEDRAAENPIDQIALLSSAYLGAQFFLVQQDPPAEPVENSVEKM
jgi:hypothetical protein